MAIPIVHVADDPAQAVAQRFVAWSAALEGPAHVAVSGGSTPKALFTLLATTFRDQVPWDRITLYQVDERCVAPSHADSNWRMLKETLLDAVPEVKAHRMEAERGHDGAREYQALLLEKVPSTPLGAPVLDRVLLGMGADGHTASLFPGAPALHERDEFVVLTEVPATGAQRVTLTYPVLEAAKDRWFLVSGADKAEAFERARHGELPAGQLHNAEWFVDHAAAQA
ncbi:MAG: 6-phosphogluconolactonase [Candidatus Hydrogenedentota bacterium]